MQGYVLFHYCRMIPYRNVAAIATVHGTQISRAALQIELAGIFNQP